MARITLPGEQQGSYSIAGLFFVDGVTEVDRLTAKQAYLLGVLAGAELPDDIEIEDVAPAEAPPEQAAPEEQAPARSSQDDLTALGAGVTLAEVIEAPQDPPQADPAPAEDVPPADASGEQTDEGTGVEGSPVDAPADGTESELTADGTDISDTVSVDVPPAQDPVDADAPAPVLGESEDGATTTEAAVEPTVTGDDPVAVAEAAGTDTADNTAGTAPAGSDVTGSTDTSATTSTPTPGA